MEPLEDRTLLSLTLVSNGIPTSTIVVAQTPTVAAAYAAVELQNAIQQITAVTVPIKVDNDPSTVIQIANPGFDADVLGPGGYTLNPTGWLVSASAAGALRSPVGGLTSISPDNFGFLNPTGWLGQLLKVNGSVLHANAGDQVSISLSQGLRNDATASTQDLRIRLWSNQIGTGTLLQETAFSAVPATTWVTRNVTYTASGSGVGNDLYLQLASVTADYAQINVEDVSGSYSSGVRLLVGESAITHTYGYYNSSFQSQQYTVDFQTNDLVLMGNDKQDVITGYNPSNYNLQNVTLPGYFTDQATGYAVFDFLEHNLGVRWYNPTASGTVYSIQGSTLTVSGADVNRSPSYGMRTMAFPTGYGYDYDAGVDTLWPAGTDQFNSWRSAAYPGEPLQPNIDRDVHLFLHRMRVGGQPNVANHSLYSYYGRFAATHPDWFAQGYPITPSSQLNYSNPEVIAQVAQDAADYYSGVKSGADLGMPWLTLPNPYPIVPMDNSAWSTDATSQSWMDSDTSGFFANSKASDYIFNFVNQVVAALHAKPGHNNDKVVALAYSDYAAPPTSVTLDLSVDVQFAFDANRQVYAQGAYNHETELVQAWRAQSSQRNLGLWLYPCFPWDAAIAGNFKLFPGYYAHSIGDQFSLFGSDYDAGIYYDGWGQEVEAYVSFQLLNDRSQNVDALLDQYFAEMYGPAAAPMQAFYNLVEQTYSNPNNYPPSQGLATNPTPPHQTEVVAWGWLGTAERMAQLEGYVTQAISAAGSSNPYATRVALFNTGTWQYMQQGRQHYLDTYHPPTVSATVSPAPEAIPAIANLTINASASDSDGTIASVTFFGDGQVLGIDTAAPYSCTWGNVPRGTHRIIVLATDNGGNSTPYNIDVMVGLPLIQLQPTNQATDPGQAATFIVQAAGVSDPTYQWRKYNAGTSAWDDIAGATGAYYTTAATTQTDNGSQYRVVVSNSCGSTTSNPATLYVNYGSEGWWKLDETSGTSASDASGNGHTGTLTNFPTTKWATGVINNAVVLDGTDSYISVPAPAGSALKYTGAELTLSTWVYVNTTETNGAYLISKPWNAVGDAYNYQVGFNSGSSSTTGTVFFSLQGSTPAGAYTITSPSGISTAAWHHIAATVDSSKVMKLYIDGVNVVSGTHNITAWAPTDGNKALVIGSKWTYSSGSYGSSTLGGKMDNVRVYTHTLSAEAVAEQARAPIGFWKLNDASGTTATDSSGNSYSGTLTNGPTWTTGEYDGALAFDGTDSYVSVASANALKYKGAELTLSTWVYVNSTETNGAYLISKPWNTSNGQFNYGLSIDSSRNVIFSLQGTSTSYTLTSPGTISTNAWHHVAATVDSSKAAKLYIDGIQVNSGTHTITAWAPTDSNKPLVIGSKYNYSAGSYSSTTLDGKLDNVQVYDRVLNASSIQSLALATPPSIVAQPTNQAADPGQTATFVVQLAGTGPLTYQWQKYNTTTSLWENIAGAIGAYYTTSDVVVGDDGSLYRVIITNGLGAITSDSVTLYVNDGAFAWWKLNETGSTTTVTDATGNGHNGSLYYEPVPLWTNGINNGALAFNGSNSYVEVPYTSAMEYVGNELTLSGWVYVNPTESTGGVIISKAWNGSGQYNYFLSIDAQNHGVFVLQNGPSQGRITSPNAIPAGGWRHVAATVDSSKLMTLYIDGIAVASMYHAITDWTPSGGNDNLPIAIGTLFPYGPGWWTGTPDYTFDGKLDDVRMYTHTLSAEAIAEQARCPIGVWKFDETSGGYAADSSGNGNTGTLVYEPMWTTSGEFNGALAFDGSNDYVEVPYAPAIEYVGGGLTLGAWVYVNPTETTGGVFISKAWNGSGQYNYLLGIDAQNHGLFKLQTGSNEAIITSPNAMPAGGWHHVAATVDSLKLMTLYIDGAAVASMYHAITDWTPSSGNDNLPIAIGTLFPYGPGWWTGNTAYSFDGKLDNVRVYNQALSAAAVLSIAIDPPPLPRQGDEVRGDRVVRSSVASHPKSSAETTFGDLSTYAALVGDASRLSSSVYSVLANALTRARRLDDGLSIPTNRLAATFCDRAPAVSERPHVKLDRSRVDAALATVGVKSGSLFKDGDDDDALESALDWHTIRQNVLEYTKVVSAIDSYFGVKNRREEQNDVSG